MSFVRHAQHRKKRLKPVWRRPRGLHNKMRLQKKGHRPVVKPGYRTPAVTRGTKKGLAIVNVYNITELESINPKTEGVVIGKVGLKNRIELLTKCKELKITVLTGEPGKQLESLKKKHEKMRKEAKEKREDREERREERKKTTEKKAPKKPEEKKAEEEDKEEEKTAEEKEKEKILTKAR